MSDEFTTQRATSYRASAARILEKALAGESSDIVSSFTSLMATNRLYGITEHDVETAET